MMPLEFHLLRPLWLLLLIPLLLLLWRLHRAHGDGNAWQGVVDAHLLPRLLSEDTGRTRRLPLVLLALGWSLGVVALAGPTWERLPQPVYQAQAYRVMLLDLSPSMNASDIPPSRLAHARFELLDLLGKVKEGQTALLAYGAEAFLVSPLTSDTATIAAQVPSLVSGLLPVEGSKRTDLALAQAGELLRQAGAPNGEVILITDGLVHPTAAHEAVRALGKEGYSVSVLGVGSAKGAPVPLADGGFLKDADGAILLPKLDADGLSELARLGGGRYVTAGPDDRDVELLIPADPTRSYPRCRTAGDQDGSVAGAGPLAVVDPATYRRTRFPSWLVESLAVAAVHLATAGCPGLRLAGPMAAPRPAGGPRLC
jgi:Ca-activated chloride channel family protein